VSTQLVAPSAIEGELVRIWEGLEKENKLRASLFTLVVFTKYSARTDYFRHIVQKVVEKFPCRVLFISEDTHSKQPFLKTAVSVLNGPCEQIDIGAAGTDIEKVPSLVLAHLLPDLPITLLWAEDPSKSHPLFERLSSLAHRVIFDSECTDKLSKFAKAVLALHQQGKDVADLNWARTEGWRDLVASLFSSAPVLKEVHIEYNDRPTEFFSHLKIQSLYLEAWFQSRLGKMKCRIDSDCWEKLGPGTIISVKLHDKTGLVYDCSRIRDRYHSVCIQIASPEKCLLPYEFMLGQTASGQSLVQEICRRGTSCHYVDMLQKLC